MTIIRQLTKEKTKQDSLQINSNSEQNDSVCHSAPDDNSAPAVSSKYQFTS